MMAKVFIRLYEVGEEGKIGRKIYTEEYELTGKEWREQLKVELDTILSKYRYIREIRFFI